MRILLVLLALAVLVTLPACDSGTGTGGTYALSVDQSSYTAGGTVTLRLTNNSQAAIQVNLCSSTLQRQQAGGTGWSIIAEGRTCNPGTSVLASGQTASETIVLPASLTPGRYRYAATVEASNDTALVFVEFDVN